MTNTIEVILDGSVKEIEYDSRKAQKDGYIEYCLFGKQREITDVQIGSNIPIAIADDVIDWVPLTVHGFSVPDHLLGVFISTYPERTILRQ